MIIPQTEQTPYFATIAQQYNFRFSHLLQNLSPSLPLHFDKTYLPKNICQKQLINLYQCNTFKQHDGAQSCSFYLSNFQLCRRNRDIQILEGIKQWQAKHINNLDKKNREMYLQGLTFKLNRLKQQYSKIPSTSAQSLKLQQVQSQIQQIKWRMKNINTTIKNIQANQNKSNNNVGTSKGK